MAASFVENGDTVCDVGCDHGKLCAYLLETGRAQNVIATDINSSPLSKAIGLIEEKGLSDRARFFLTDGLKDIGDTSRITHVVIAGLGGHTMADILSRAPFVRRQKVRLVLLPAQSGHAIRRWLYENGFGISEERTVEEKGKYYSCISAVYTGCPSRADEYRCYIGASENCRGPAAVGYFSMVLSQLEKKRRGQRPGGPASVAAQKVRRLIEKTGL